jgi:hypothetical protein
MIEDTVSVAVREPDARFAARREDADTRGLNSGGEVHGAAIVTEEDVGPG